MLPPCAFFGIEKINIPARGGDTNRILLQRELYWIHTLDCHNQDLNDEFDLKVML